MASSPPSFDHLPFAADTEREHYTAHPLQAQIYRNGRMKYERTRASEAEVVMPDGEIVARNMGDDGSAGEPFGSR
ncbi:MAG: hypothetical protein L0H23_04505 [Luteimonas sp.]|nr:hypothetical protein [Luteimonas sp.]